MQPTVSPCWSSASIRSDSRLWMAVLPCWWSLPTGRPYPPVLARSCRFLCVADQNLRRWRRHAAAGGGCPPPAPDGVRLGDEDALDCEQRVRRRGHLAVGPAVRDRELTDLDD